MFRSLIDQQKRLHLELTTRCTLGCPGCNRTIFADRFNRAYPKIDLDLDHLIKFFDCESGRRIESFTLCGDYGDSIYYPRLLELIKAFRDTKTFRIVTNGSHRDEKFWHNLIDLLTPADSINFSIDGLEDYNHLYRKNADWDSIMIGLNCVSASNIPFTWNTNLFNFNYNKIDEIRAFAEGLGAKFIARKTSRFGDNKLMPPEHYISTVDLFDRRYTELVIDIEPKCFKQRSISATGQFNPCSWIAAPDTYYKTNLHRDRDLWSIYKNTFDQILDRLDSWATEIKNHPEKAHVLCKMKCKPQQPIAIFHDDTEIHY